MILGYSTTFSRYLHYIPCITYIVNDSIENPIYVDCRLSGLKIENLSAKKKNVYLHSCDSADSSPSDKTSKTVDLRI